MSTVPKGIFLRIPAGNGTGRSNRSDITVTVRASVCVRNFVYLHTSISFFFTFAHFVTDVST